ncbi:hypothetical protein GC163_06385 [bacterium]|nr:hypothetical protein [bacterium]
MPNRLRRFLQRVQGTQRTILLIALVYDLYLYKTMVDGGLTGFVFLVSGFGIVAGIMAGVLLQSSPIMLVRVVDVAAFTAMGILLSGQCFQLGFPLWVYGVAHTFVWFWFTAFFWLHSRPFEYDFFADESDDWQDV